MKVLIEKAKGDYYYKDLVGQEFDVVEKFDLLHDGLYFVNGKHETNGNWFRKNDCKILDEDYLKSLETLRINERLDYYNNRLEETEQKLKLYESGEYKERFEGDVKLKEFKKAVELLQEANEEIQNLYGRDTGLTNRIYEFLEVVQKMMTDD